MSYLEHRPPPALSRFVDRIWTFSSAGPSATRVLPDGCVDAILDLSAGESYLVGTMTRPISVSRSGPSEMLAVRFRPAGAYPFIGLSIGELTDTRIDLGSVWPELDELAKRLADSHSSAERVSILGRFLSSRIEDPPEPRIAAAVAAIESSRGIVSVERLSRDVGLSRQHLTRLFERHVGVGVKLFARVTRLRSLLRALEPHPPDWAGLALDFGYFDQAHLISDFKALTGLTPKESLRHYGAPSPALVSGSHQRDMSRAAPSNGSARTASSPTSVARRVHRDATRR